MKQKRFYFRIRQCGDEDGDNIWVDATSESEARDKVYSEWHSINDLMLIKVKAL